MSFSDVEESALHPNIQEAIRSWRAKPSLRAVYGEFYEALAARMPTGGRILEIGAGSGHSRDFLNDLDIIRLDILSAPWVDIAADAHNVPLADQSVDGILMIDALHHFADPAKFFGEVDRLLKPSGRFAMIEPGITPVSGILYRNFHAEPVDMKVNPMEPQAYGVGKDPFDSNQAIPTLIFKKKQFRMAFEQNFPTLKIVETRWKSLAAYPMTGGFQPWSLLPSKMARGLTKVEALFEPMVGRVMAFRLLVTLEKTHALL